MIHSTQKPLICTDCRQCSQHNSDGFNLLYISLVSFYVIGMEVSKILREFGVTTNMWPSLMSGKLQILTLGVQLQMSEHTTYMDTANYWDGMRML